MRWASMLLLSALLFSVPAVAHVIPAPEGSQPGTLFKSPPESHHLFFLLTPEQSWTGPKILEFRIRVDGKPYLTETLTLSGISLGKPASFELLAEMRPALEALHNLAERSDRVRIQILLDGRKIRELSFHELVLSNLDERHRTHAREAKSSIHAFVADALPKPDSAGLKSIVATSLDPQCVDDCEDQLNDCANNQCGGVYCEECDPPYQACLASCDCTDPKSSYTYQTTTQLQQSVGTACLYIISYHHSHWHSITQYQTKTTTWQRTEYCDGSFTVVEVSSSYSAPVYCPGYTPFDCWPDEGTALGCS